MKTKVFDCVEMKRRGALRIYEETKDLSFDEQVEYWRRRSEEFRCEQKQPSKTKRRPRQRNR
jgi:hypothetical protein